MLPIPCELLSCSWPRPVAEANGRWSSEPDWNAPASPFRPQPLWKMVDGEPAWTIDWCNLFRGGMASLVGSEMRRFHVVFRIRAAETGRLVFWDDDGCIIRLGGRVIHEDRSAHGLRRAEVEVRAGDVLEVAQWQFHGDWIWCARSPGSVAGDAEAVLAPHRDAVRERVRTGGGPPLKLYTDGRNPLRAVVAVYSLVLNGYAPSSILLYGSHQWSAAAAQAFRAALPFAEVVETARVLGAARALGGHGLAEMARRYWFVMKACVGLLDGPEEFGLVDDDLFVLDPVDDALEAFRRHDLVFIPDCDHAREYHRTWGAVFRQGAPSPAGRFNAGLYWCRLADDRRRLAARMAQVRADRCLPWLWEQGFIAAAYAQRPLHELPTQRYFYPLFDGLPGGALGYDWAGNPCGFASLHFGGLPDKPDDTAMRYIGPQLLARRAARPADARLALAG
ncbi:MAG: hypothetical protein ACJ8GN_29365 [Longimicrobiaceae bacterium]